jgi:hypothetical protein
MSYVDVILQWCIEIWWLEFAKEFILLTWGWEEEFILNDRDNPRYPRYLKNLKYKKEIDQLIEMIKNNMVNFEYIVVNLLWNWGKIQNRKR